MNREAKSALKEEIFRLLRAEGPRTAPEVAERLNAEEPLVRDAMQVLALQARIVSVPPPIHGEERFRAK